jgi:hypothetical protein
MSFAPDTESSREQLGAKYHDATYDASARDHCEHHQRETQAWTERRYNPV